MNIDILNTIIVVAHDFFFYCFLFDLECASFHARLNPDAPNRALDSNPFSRSLSIAHSLTLPVFLLFLPFAAPQPWFYYIQFPRKPCSFRVIPPRWRYVAQRPWQIAPHPLLPKTSSHTQTHAQTFARSTMSQASQDTAFQCTKNALTSETGNIRDRWGTWLLFCV